MKSHFMLKEPSYGAIISVSLSTLVGLFHLHPRGSWEMRNLSKKLREKYIQNENTFEKKDFVRKEEELYV